MRARSLLAAGTLAICSLFSSCLPGQRPPEVAPSRTLELGAEAKGAAMPAAFGVVFAGPKGETDDASEITLVFNRPLRPLELADDGDETPAPVKIEVPGGRAPEGRWHWLGSSVLVFSPKSPLPRATEFVVTVPAGTRSLGGEVLAAPYQFRFQTPAPRLVRSEPSDRQHWMPRQVVDLFFNQPVEPGEVRRAGRLLVVEGAKERSVPFVAETPKTDGKGSKGEPIRTRVRVTPSEPLPLGAAVSFVLAKDLHGVEGPVPSGREQRIDARTYGPLAVARTECPRDTPHGKCAAGSGLTVWLTNEVTLEEWKKHVRVVGAKAPDYGAASDKVSQTWFVIPTELRPGRRYRVVVTAGLRDVYGQALAKDFTWDVETDDAWPSLDVGLEGSVLEAPSGPGKLRGQPREVPITTVNVASYELVVGAVDEADVARLALAEGRSDDFAKARALPGVRAVPIVPGAPTNQPAVRSVRLADVLAKTRGRGTAVLGVGWIDRDARPATLVRLVQVTDLAISARMSRFGGLVWVTRLSDGRPVAGATVAVRRADGSETFSTKADAQGVAVLPADKVQPIGKDGEVDPGLLVVARAEGDWTWQRLSDYVPPWTEGAWVDLRGELRTFGMVFTDRGIYRPGETVKVKALLREELARGTATPAGREVEIVAKDSRDQEVLRRREKLGPFGDLAADVRVPASAPLGTLTLVVRDPKIDDDRSSWVDRSVLARGGVEIAEFRPAEFKVSVEPEKASYVRGDTAAVVARGDYLFGAPMAGAHVRMTALRAPSAFHPPGTDGLVTDDETYAADLPEQGLRAAELSAREGELDGRGQLASREPLPLPGQRGTEAVTFEAEVTDASRQVLAGRSTVLVHPAEFYLALAPPRDLFVDRGAKLRPTAFAVEPGGAKRAGVRVRFELVRRTWESVLRATGESGATYDSKVVDAVVAGCDAASGDAPAGCELLVPDVGYYVLRASAKDARGNPIAASAPLYAVSDAASFAWPMEGGRTLVLVPDKSAYRVGDTARVLVKNPFGEAEAIVTVERAGIYRRERMTLRGSMPTLRVPITDDLWPNAYVTVQLVKGRTKDAPPGGGADPGAPAFATGHATLAIDPEARRLRVAVVPRERELGPGSTVEAEVRVTDAAGKPVPGQVVFYAVDEGVLSLTGYKTPDPVPVFGAPRPLAVFTLESRTELARIVRSALSQGGEDKGLDGGGGGAAVRGDFRSTAFFDPNVTVGADGRARVRFKLPDGLTTYRLMAVASSADDRFGFGESSVVTSKKLMARPALPRFLRAGDAISAGMIVTAKGLAATSVETELSVEGARLESPAKQIVALPKEGSAEVRWAIAAPAAGTARFTMKVRAGAEVDAVQVVRTIAVPASLEAAALYGDTDRAAGEKLGDLRAIRPDVGGLDVTLASTALVGMEGGVEQLVEYPYGCTEQLVSRLVPLVVLRDLARDFGLPLPPDVERRADDAIAKLVANQHEDGAFGYWPDSRRADAWVTAYAVWGLHVSKAHGRAVPERALEDGLRALRELLRVTPGDTLALSQHAFVVDVLAEVGRPDAGYASRLWERRGEMPVFARALLAHAMVRGRMDEKQAAELVRDLENHLRASGAGALVVENVGDAYAPLLDSPARTTALALRALLALDRAHPLASRLAKGLLAARDGGRWRSTQEAAWALIALDEYRRTQEAKAPEFDARVFLGDALLGRAPFHERSAKTARIHVGADALAAAVPGSVLAFDVEGHGRLFYEARLRYARTTLPTMPLDRGFAVRRVLRSVAPGELAEALRTLPVATSTKVRGGSLVLVDLVVATPTPREHVVIEDPLPAGLEAIDATLATSTRSLAVEEAGGAGDQADEEASDDDARATGGAWTRAWYHREVRDDRVLTFVEHMPAGIFRYRYLARATTVGTYVVPPTRAECMYEPEVFGRTAASTFEVLR
jgi:uncharacterized protein YfaS (alpha-2-macroglobulin family)